MHALISASAPPQRFPVPFPPIAPHSQALASTLRSRRCLFLDTDVAGPVVCSAEFDCVASRI
eukprot:234971-Rhodomonas_salina.1